MIFLRMGSPNIYYKSSVMALHGYRIPLFLAKISGESIG